MAILFYLWLVFSLDDNLKAIMLNAGVYNGPFTVLWL